MNTPTANQTAGWRRAFRLAAMQLALVTGLALPVTARGDDKEKAEAVDARLESYPQAGALPEAGGTVPTWMFFGVLTTVAVGVLFINSKRTHLD